MRNRKLFSLFSSKPAAVSTSNKVIVSAAQRPPLSPLERLPEEITREILSYLSFVDLQPLLNTSRQYYHYLFPQTLYPFEHLQGAKDLYPITFEATRDYIASRHDLINKYKSDLEKCEKKAKSSWALDDRLGSIFDNSMVNIMYIVLCALYIFMDAFVSFKLLESLPSYRYGDYHEKKIALLVAACVFVLGILLPTAAIGVGISTCFAIFSETVKEMDQRFLLRDSVRDLERGLDEERSSYKYYHLPSSRHVW